MEIAKDYLNRFTKGKGNERAVYVQECADLTGKPFKQMLGLTRHLPVKWIRDLLDDARSAQDSIGKQKKFWWLLKKTR